LFRKAIQDIKIVKRKKTDAAASAQKMEIEKKKKIDAQIQKDIVQVKRRLGKATDGARKAQENIKKFGKEIGDATRRREPRKAEKFKRVIQKRQQNLKRAMDARTKATSNLRTLEQKLQGIRSSSPQKLGPSLMKSSPAMKRTTSPSKLGASPAKQQQQQSARKLEEQKRQSAKRVEDQKRQQQQSARKLEEQKRQSAKKVEDQKRQQQQTARKLEEQKRQSAKKVEDQKRQQQQSARKLEEQRKRQQQSMKKRSAPMMRPRTPSPIKRRR
jgi:hypothetical protein